MITIYLDHNIAHYFVRGFPNGDADRVLMEGIGAGYGNRALSACTVCGLRLERCRSSIRARGL